MSHEQEKEAWRQGETPSSRQPQGASAERSAPHAARATKLTLVAGSVSTRRSGGRIRDRRDPKDYSDDANFFEYEYPAAGELPLLEGASDNSIIRWVLERYDVGGALREYLELLDMDDTRLTKLHGGILPRDPVAPSERAASHRRYRALAIVSTRENVLAALAEEDVGDAVMYGVQGVLDCELYLKHSSLPRLVVPPLR